MRGLLHVRGTIGSSEVPFHDPTVPHRIARDCGHGSIAERDDAAAGQRLLTAPGHLTPVEVARRAPGYSSGSPCPREA